MNLLDVKKYYNEAKQTYTLNGFEVTYFANNEWRVYLEGKHLRHTYSGALQACLGYVKRNKAH